MPFKSRLISLLIFLIPFQAGSVTFDASNKVSKLSQPHLSGTCLPVFNPKSTYNKIKSGLTLSHYVTMRYPNGTLSNEFHWNSKGTTDSEGIWRPDTANCLSVFQCTNLYCGTSSTNWSTVRYSNVMDDDTNTFWWSDPLISESDPYIYAAWRTEQKMDSVVILWGKRYSTSFEVQEWTGELNYPGPHQMPENLWNTVFSSTSGSGGRTEIKFPSVSSYALRIISHEGISGKDIQIKEIYVYSEGKQVSSNAPNYDHQNSTFSSSTHPGMKKNGNSTWTFPAFMDYLDTLGYPAIPVICVNYGSGTPEEAAAWVYYANKVKKYNIRYWQIGNEMDGEWELGGPVSAFTYAEKFVKYVKAMKAADSTIKILGPVESSNMWKPSGEYNGKTWMESAVMKIGEAEKTDNCKYLDGVDFHLYPYWTSSAINISSMVHASDSVYNQADSILAWINRYLRNPDSVMVMMSEYNASTIMCNALNRSPNGIINANMNAGLAYKCGYRAMSVIWDSYEGGSAGPDGTRGALTLFNNAATKVVASMEPTPSSAFWGNFMVTNLWLDPNKDNWLISADTCNAGDLRYFGNTTDNDSRVLVLNLSATDSLNVNVNMTGASYQNVQVYSWGEREFLWHGGDENAYAAPNCGPSSYVTTGSNLGTPKIGPMCAMVLRYFNSDSGSSVPERTFLSSVNSVVTKPGDTIDVSVSYRVEKGTIQSVAYKLDAAPFENVSALDGAFDGSYENCRLKFDSRNLGEGNFNLILKVKSSSGDSCLDTVVFVGYSAVIKPRVGGTQIIPLTVSRMSGGVFRINYLPEGKGVSYIKIFRLTGELVKDFYSERPGAPLEVTWDGKNAKGKGIAPGFLVVKAGVIGGRSERSQMIGMLK